MYRLTSCILRRLCRTVGAGASVLVLLWGIAPVSQARAQRVMTVIASDTGLASAPTVPAGLVTVRLVITGATRRELVVHRVPVGTVSEEIARGAAGRPTRWFEQWSFGGPAVPRDSATDASVTVDLRPGRYVLVAYAVDSNGRPRGNQYIWREFTAIAASALIAARFPVPDARVRIKDGSIEVLGVMGKGLRTLQVENAGAFAHELLVARLKPGKTVDDVKRWNRDRSDAAPFVYIGGVTPMSPSMTTQTRLVLQSGVHVVLCPMRGDRGADYERGVLTSFRVN